jgi:hypothetical protein
MAQAGCGAMAFGADRPGVVGSPAKNPRDAAAGGARGSRGSEHMHFDLAAIPQSDAYKLLVSTVVPRPIALATTVDRAGRVNAAPFSFFNAVSSAPPVVVLGISPSAGDPNHVATGEMRLVGRMHGRGWHARTNDLFLMERISLAEWKAEEKDNKQ